MDFHTIFNDRLRAKALDEMSVKLKNGWDLTVHFEQPLINHTELPIGGTEKEFLDNWEHNKSIFNRDLAQVVDDFGLAALIASVTQENQAGTEGDAFKPSVWFHNLETSLPFTFIRSIDFRSNEKLIEVKLDI
ncbi:hypothetical protein SAMN05216327_106380 [Dyadobacter sp. SG02]|uniref:hypothetical protein n=1 Tax=Dyadobacter sp. SG02 TaxID=1855291 RepID=UPI0008D088F1|nr:hypothetical protein [Dyadobacter sp. SG02]SEJ15615.1 hypothetical protein SAMN05216327_106380 [Dyadobacter sp. SG02]